MKRSIHTTLILFGAVGCWLMQSADAQVAHGVDRDRESFLTQQLDAYQQAETQPEFDSQVACVGFCDLADHGSESSCDAIDGDASSCDAMGMGTFGGCKPKCDCCWCRKNLTGDWGGFRTSLAEDCGVQVDTSLTQFYQGVASGGREQRFRYGAKLDVLVNASTEKLGLWKGGMLTMHAVDWQFGRSSIGDAVGLAPVNTAMLTPKANEPSFGLTSLLLTQELGGGWAATVGRLNVVDLWAGFFPEYGRGLDGFMNVSSLLPLSVIPSVPLVTNGAGLMKVGQRGVEAAVLVLESQQSPTTVGLDFPNGVVMLGIGRKYTDFGNKPGSHTLVGGYATGDYTSFDAQGWAIVPGGGIEPAEKEGTWVAAYLGEQQLWADQCNPARHTKLFGYAGFSDSENSPFAWTSSVSIESFGPTASRPGDRAGISYFYSSLNSDFQNIFSIVSPLGDVHGGEVYYNAEITPWFHLTFDLQAIDPAVEARDTAIVLGTRAKIDF